MLWLIKFLKFSINIDFYGFLGEIICLINEGEDDLGFRMSDWEILHFLFLETLINLTQLIKIRYIKSG